MYKVAGYSCVLLQMVLRSTLPVLILQPEQTVYICDQQAFSNRNLYFFSDDNILNEVLD